MPLASATAPEVALAARRTAGAGRRRPGEGSGGRLPDGEQRMRRPSGSGSGKVGRGSVVEGLVGCRAGRGRGCAILFGPIYFLWAVTIWANLVRLYRQSYIHLLELFFFLTIQCLRFV